jgi:hypothetical protein
MVTRRNEQAPLNWLLGQPDVRLLIDLGSGHTHDIPVRLTFQGWQRFEALGRGAIQTRIVFMAMQFGDDDLTRVVNECFRPAVARAGFELRVLSDKPRAGSIDDQLRVALRTSRFALADLTHGNHGAYWEAGFAEGLGRPVIYTCRKAEWDERRTHFDTNHLQTIIWEPDKLDDTGAQLTAMIRETLPGEAKMTDD